MTKSNVNGERKIKFYFLRLPADHEKSDSMCRLIYYKGNEGYGLYIRLLQKATPGTGFIEYAGIESTIEEQLSFDLNITKDECSELIRELEKLGLVERITDEQGALLFREAALYTVDETPEAARQRRYREKHRKNSKNTENQQNNDMLQSNAEALQSNDNNIYNNNHKLDLNTETEKQIDEIYSAYPKKQNEENARLEISKRIKEGENPERLLNASKMYALECDCSGAIIMYPDNFFKREGRYLSYKNKSPDDIKADMRKLPKKKEEIAFRNFEQRKYDFSKVEKQLVCGDTGNQSPA